MEKEKAELAVSIQNEKQELSQLATVKAEIKSVEQIPTGKTMFGGKVTVDEEDYRKVASLAKSSWLVKERKRNYQKKFLLCRKRIRL